jgi:hypothetical protein
MNEKRNCKYCNEPLPNILGTNIPQMDKESGDQPFFHIRCHIVALKVKSELFKSLLICSRRDCADCPFMLGWNKNTPGRVVSCHIKKELGFEDYTTTNTNNTCKDCKFFDLDKEIGDFGTILSTSPVCKHPRIVEYMVAHYNSFTDVTDNYNTMYYLIIDDELVFPEVCIFKELTSVNR